MLINKIRQLIQNTKNQNELIRLTNLFHKSISLTNSNLNILQDVNTILIRQENNIGDIGLGLSEPFMYKYSIYNYDKKNKKIKEKLLNLKEIDPPYTNYYAGNRRQINLEVTEPYSTRKLLRFTKPIQFSLLKYNRPYLQIEYFDEDDNNYYLGEINTPFSWMNYNYTILNQDYQLEYYVKSNISFQIMFSRLQIKQFMKCHFHIYDGNDNQNEIGFIESLFYYHSRKQQTIADLFIVSFPYHSTIEQKCRILGMAVLNDFWIFGGIPKLQMAYNYA